MGFEQGGVHKLRTVDFCRKTTHHPLVIQAHCKKFRPSELPISCPWVPCVHREKILKNACEKQR